MFHSQRMAQFLAGTCNFDWVFLINIVFDEYLLVSLDLQIMILCLYRGADKSLARPGRKQALKRVKNARDFNNIETRAFIKFFFSAR
jgi:hypothetical protein